MRFCETPVISHLRISRILMVCGRVMTNIRKANQRWNVLFVLKGHCIHSKKYRIWCLDTARKQRSLFPHSFHAIRCIFICTAFSRVNAFTFFRFFHSFDWAHFGWWSFCRVAKFYRKCEATRRTKQQKKLHDHSFEGVLEWRHTNHIQYAQ